MATMATTTTPAATLTTRQQRFVDEYLIDLNAKAAYIRAGYTATTDGAARAGSARLLAHANVAAAVAAGRAKLSEKTAITAARVLDELAKIGFANMADYLQCTPGQGDANKGDPYFDFSRLTRDQAAAIVEVTVDDYMDGRGENAREVRRVKFKLADKLNALGQIGRHLGMFVDRTEVSGPNGAPLALSVVRDLGDVSDAELQARIERLQRGKAVLGYGGAPGLPALPEPAGAAEPAVATGLPAADEAAEQKAQQAECASETNANEECGNGT